MLHHFKDTCKISVFLWSWASRDKKDIYDHEIHSKYSIDKETKMEKLFVMHSATNEELIF